MSFSNENHLEFQTKIQKFPGIFAIVFRFSHLGMPASQTMKMKRNTQINKSKCK